MPRKSFDELIAQNLSTLPDNTSGAISPADVRNMIGEFLNTQKPAYGVYAVDTNSGNPTQDFDTTEEVVTLWNSAPVFTPEFQSDVSGGIICNETMVVRVTVSMSLEFASGKEMIFAIKSDELTSPTVYGANVQGRGSGKPVSVNIPGLFDITSTGVKIAVYGKMESGSDTVTCVGGAFICEHVPLIMAPPNGVLMA